MAIGWACFTIFGFAVNIPLTSVQISKIDEFSAAAKIEAIVKQFESNYAVKDKQDLLAMCALQLSSKVESSEGKTLVDTTEIDANIDAIEANISAMLKRSLT